MNNRVRSLLLVPGIQSAIAVAVILALFSPAHWFGWLWILPILGLICGFIVGWAAARRYWRKHGYVPKL